MEIIICYNDVKNNLNMTYAENIIVILVMYTKLSRLFKYENFVLCSLDFMLRENPWASY
jgi:hypothetical protein